MKTLEELLAEWEAAEAALKSDPKNADKKQAALDAKAAYDAKKAESESEDKDDDDGETEEGEEDDSKLDPKAQLALIAKLRKENAKHRVKGKDLKSKLTTSEAQKKAILKAAGIETEEEDPTEKIKTLTVETQQKDFQLAILQSAVQFGVPGEALKYYEFLVSQAINELSEDEEFSFDGENEKLAEIVKEAKARNKSPANTSVKSGDGKKPPPPGSSSEVSLGQFVRMSMVEKDELYRKRPEIYQKLVGEAKAQKKLV